MTRDDKPDVLAEKANEYAFWAIPGVSATVTYSLPLFHEIDFAVNEGFRKIPHGGIEEGGLLFGKVDAKGTTIDAFRPIECEHASGPSFLLSEHDVEVLTGQIAGAGADEGLAGLELVGWFLAHTRGPLVLTDGEVEFFDRYFGRPGMLTVLVKPERFQPTRFGFLVRGQNGAMPKDATQTAVILPLPGRNAKASNGPIPSIPAPAVNSTAVRRLADVGNAQTVEQPAAKNEEPARPAKATEKAAENRSTRRQRRLHIEQVAPKEEEHEESAAAELEHSTGVPSTGEELEPVRLGALVGGLGEGAVAVRHAPYDHDGADELHDPYAQIELLTKRKPTSTTARLVMVLPLAALFGCVVGYLAYLQVPSPLIPLMVKSRGQTVLVTWPADQTRGAVYAAVRVDDSTPVMLTPEERNSGRVEVTASADMKVELIARNWIHDSRGIVRFVKPLANTAP